MARLSRYEKILVVLFVLSLPLVNPWVRGDGVGYYAFGRTLLIQHDLNFKQDWLRANPTFRMGRTDAAGNILSTEYTSTGHLDMYFNPSWSHALSAFVVALFVWYWDRTRDSRSWSEWVILGAMGGDHFLRTTAKLIAGSRAVTTAHQDKGLECAPHGTDIVRQPAFAIPSQVAKSG